MKRMTRMTALLLSLGVAISLCACGDSGSPSDTAPQDSSKTGQDSQNPQESSSKAEESSADDLVTLKILCKNDYNSEIKTADWEKYDVSQTFISELAEMGIRLELECIANDNFSNVVNTRMAAGVDVPDIIAVAFDGTIGSQDVVNWGQNGLVYPASKLMEEYDEDGSIAAFWDKYAPGTRGAQTAPDGNLYWFAYLNNSGSFDKETKKPLPGVNYRLPSIREDWVTAAGETLQQSYTPDELFDLLVKIQEADPNGNSIKDEVVCVQIDGFNDNLARGFGLNTSTLAHIDDEGRVQSNFYDPATLEYLAFMNKLYENGLYDTAAFSGDLFSSELISSNKAAITYNYAGWGDYEKQIAAEGAQYMPFVLNINGDLGNGWYANGDHPGQTYNQYFVTSACEHPEAAAKLFDFVYSEKYAKLCAGIEGVTFEIDENGVMNTIDVGAMPEDEEGKWDYRYRYKGLNAASIGLYALPHMVVFPSYVEQVKSNDEEYIQKKQLAVKGFNEHFDTCSFQYSTPFAIATDEENDRLSELSEPLSTYASEMLSDIILGQRDISTFEDGVAELEKLGLKEYMEIVQARYDRAVEAAK